MEVQHIEKLMPKTRIMKVLNTIYEETLRKLNLSEFITLEIPFKMINSIFANRTTIGYYLILGPEKLCKKFVKNLFESFHNNT